MEETASQGQVGGVIPVAEPEQLLPSAELASLGEWTTAELRTRRSACEEAEEGVSYARRLLQGRLDILRAELDRRDEAGAADLMAALPTILSADGTRSDPLHARSTRLRVPPNAAAYEDAIAAVIAVDEHDLEQHDLEELAPLVDRLGELEHAMSHIRRELFRRIDALRDELAARYKDGRADVSELLR